jgi:hypothetical protein
MFASHPHQVFRQINNENPVHASKINNSNVANSKTPAASSKQRRALGDISNRKQVEGYGTGVGAKKMTRLLLHQQSNPLSTNPPKLYNTTEAAFLPRPAQIKHDPSVQILPEYGKGKHMFQSSEQKILLQNEVLNITTDHVDDIEVPAGRLWADQQDDDSYEDAAVSESNWEDCMTKRHEYRLKCSREEKERNEAEYQASLEMYFRHDGKNCPTIVDPTQLIMTDSLILCASFAEPEAPAIVGADTWIERTLSFDVDLEGELTLGRPLFCSDISF